jgi:hypothetical protein
MAESTTPAEARAAGAPKKRAARRRPAAARKVSAASRPARRPARSKQLDRLIRQLATQASRTGSRIASISKTGVATSRRGWGKASAASKKAIDRLTTEWRKMDTKKRIQLISAILGAVAAASAPIVRKKLQKR